MKGRTSRGGTSPRPCVEAVVRSRPPRARDRGRAGRGWCSIGHARNAGSSAAWARGGRRDPGRLTRRFPAFRASLDSTRGTTHLRARERVRVTCTFRGQRRLSPDEVARYLFRRVVHWGRSSNVFLENGARLYLDVGSHPEYATPECDQISDLVAHDKAGERILEALLAAAEVGCTRRASADRSTCSRTTPTPPGNSYGCHGTTWWPRQGEFARMADLLIPFFVTRQIWCGAGKVLHGPRGAVFCIAQRAEHIWEGVSSATTRSRPIINTRDEPHADAERFRRLHVIVGDSNMSEFTTWMKVGITDLVLRMVEANTVMRDLSLENPIRAIREISHDVTVPRRSSSRTGGAFGDRGAGGVLRAHRALPRATGSRPRIQAAAAGVARGARCADPAGAQSGWCARSIGSPSRA